MLVVLVDFSDKSFDVDTTRFDELFFSTGTIATGSVKEYHEDVTGGLVEITGQVVGPHRPPALDRRAGRQGVLPAREPPAAGLRRRPAGGDGTDCYPGWYDNHAVTGTTTPSTVSYVGTDSGVVVARISDSGPQMSAVVSVSGTVPPDQPGDPGDPGDLVELQRTVQELKQRVDALAHSAPDG